MKAGDSIYIIQLGSIEDEPEQVVSVHSTHRGAISFCVQEAKKMVADMNEDDTAEWIDASDLDTYSMVRRRKAKSHAFQDICWWDIKVVKLKY